MAEAHCIVQEGSATMAEAHCIVQEGSATMAEAHCGVQKARSAHPTKRQRRSHPKATAALARGK
jgi:hypothetical protein